MILVILSTHAELASATARGRSYRETGEFEFVFVWKVNIKPKRSEIKDISVFNARRS